MYGDIVVWADNRNSPFVGTTKTGCANCPDNPFDIYMYDLITDDEVALVESEHQNTRPAIYGQWVLWQTFREPRRSEINLLDLETGRIGMLAQAGGSEAWLGVSDDYAVWTVATACDARSPADSAVNTGVFAYDLQTNEVRQLSNFVEPRTWLHGSTVVIYEGCHFVTRVYAVFLN